ncbi:MAG: dephospho-CoA kinase [Kiloniellales bacterium]
MFVLGLTGSIGMGKSAAATMLRRMGLPLHDADKAVHRLLAKGGAAVAAIAAAFPDVVIDGAVDRQRLGAQVFEDRAALERLEAILHPAVRRATRAFLRQQARRGQDLVVLDIPLLFETGGEALCDAVIVVSAPRFVQQARVLSRPGMTAARLHAIQAKQMPDRDKRRRADFVVNTGLSKAETLRQLRAIVTLLRQRPERYRRAGARPPKRPPAHPRPRRPRA